MHKTNLTRFVSVNKGLALGARALGMGGAYTGIANDYSAIFYNPAGLGQIKRMEFNLGFDFYQYNSNAAYLNTTQKAMNSRTAIQSSWIRDAVPDLSRQFL
jgi:long-subunit fatty acid transport protein